MLRRGWYSNTAAIIKAKYFFDTYTDADTTALTSHTADYNESGNAYETITTAGHTTLTITSNKATVATGGGRKGNVVLTNFSDVVMTVIYNVTTWTANVSVAIPFRMSGTSLSSSWYGQVTSTALRIVENDTTVRATTAFTPTNGADETLVITANGTSLTATVGATSTSYTSSAKQTDKRHGVRAVSLADSPASLDDFLIEAI